VKAVDALPMSFGLLQRAVAFLLSRLIDGAATGALPAAGGGFGDAASYPALIAVLSVRPHGLFDQPRAERV
jgi:hypothetical protein